MSSSSTKEEAAPLSDLTARLYFEPFDLSSDPISGKIALSFFEKHQKH